MWVTPALSIDESAAWRETFARGLAEIVGSERTDLILLKAADDQSLSCCFDWFGSEEELVAATPLADGKCELSKLFYFTDRRPRGMVSGIRIPLASLAELSGPMPPDPLSPSGSFTAWHGLGRRALPPALVDYLNQCAASHTEIQQTGQ